MAILNLMTPSGPVLLNLHGHAAVLDSLFHLAAQRVGAEAFLPATRGCTAAPGLLTTHPASQPGETVTVAVLVAEGRVTTCGVPITPSMLRFRSREEPGHLHTCTLCDGLTEAEDRVCSPCAGAYSHWITQGGTCPSCAEVRLVRRIHEGSLSGWEECHACEYRAEIEAPEEYHGAA